ncbi:thiol peroxidase [Oceanispirochaeta sp.]|jgi:thiol peroxidase|uniref:thiol peroxidase n=1 Tax=Oceanispirochaeta sp. TaxID=2035350 RepID=UPI002630E3FD|nr:thiol peroxidase [Oceanispirochaeta sp.]MDA3955646.1 thiol peroxidase [Oceanispirochaeta sp.]
MANITLHGNPVKTIGELPGTGSKAKEFKLVKSDLEDISLSDFKGKNVILNIFPSLDTATCATSVRKFNKNAASLNNTVVICISADLPFAAGRFCTTEGLKDVYTASVFRDDNFGKDYGVLFTDGPLKGLLSRAVIVVNPDGVVTYTQQVPEIVDEPDYESALQNIK